MFSQARYHVSYPATVKRIADAANNGDNDMSRWAVDLRLLGS